VRKRINVDIRKEIIFKRESGKSVGDLSAENGMAKSTICFFRFFTKERLFMLFKFTCTVYKI